jgi:hypothetical protein
MKQIRIVAIVIGQWAVIAILLRIILTKRRFTEMYMESKIFIRF